jgi:hypothetical protein
MLKKSRAGFKYGDVTVRDHMAYDGLHDMLTDQPVGKLTELSNAAAAEPIMREEQDCSQPARTRRRHANGRTASSITRSCRSRSPNATAIRSWSRKTKWFAPTAHHPGVQMRQQPGFPPAPGSPSPARSPAWSRNRAHRATARLGSHRASGGSREKRFLAAQFGTTVRHVENLVVPMPWPRRRPGTVTKVQ